MKRALVQCERNQRRVIVYWYDVLLGKLGEMKYECRLLFDGVLVIGRTCTHNTLVSESGLTRAWCACGL